MLCGSVYPGMLLMLAVCTACLLGMPPPPFLLFLPSPSPPDPARRMVAGNTFFSHVVQVEVFPSEKVLLEAFIEASQALDPDIILGFEVQKGSLGYLADRAATMDIPLLKLVSRTPEVCLQPCATVIAAYSHIAAHLSRKPKSRCQCSQCSWNAFFRSALASPCVFSWSYNTAALIDLFLTHSASQSFFLAGLAVHHVCHGLTPYYLDLWCLSRGHWLQAVLQSSHASHRIIIAADAESQG